MFALEAVSAVFVMRPQSGAVTLLLAVHAQHYTREWLCCILFHWSLSCIVLFLIGTKVVGLWPNPHTVHSHIV